MVEIERGISDKCNCCSNDSVFEETTKVVFKVDENGNREEKCYEYTEYRCIICGEITVGSEEDEKDNKKIV